MRLSCISSAVGCLLFASLVVGGLPPLTKQEAIRIADAFAQKEGICLKCYQRPIVHYHKTKNGNYWSAYYAPIPLPINLTAEDRDFFVRVDEASRTASYEPLR
jgi:hypothetical protein